MILTRNTYRRIQCSRKAVVGNFCKQHSPEAKKARCDKITLAGKKKMDAQLRPGRQLNAFQNTLKTMRILSEMDVSVQTPSGRAYTQTLQHWVKQFDEALARIK